VHLTRMIVCDCGQPTDQGQLEEQLRKCGAEVTHSFGLIPGMAVGLSAEALQKFFSTYPNARVIPDRRHEIPRLPFGPDEWAEVSGAAVPSFQKGQSPKTSPLALELMRATDVHALGFNGDGVRVCIIDSGVDFGHPDLLETAIMDANGRPLASDFTETDLTDTLGHGTAVAGCVAAQGRLTHTLRDEVSGRAVGQTRIKGVAPGVRIMSAKVFDARVPSGYDSAIIAALEWAAANGAHIVNMSLGGQALPNDGQDPMALAVTNLRERGILVIVSAGNAGGGHGTLKSPGSSTGALTVGASTMYRSFAELGFLAEPGKWTSDQLAAFSSLGPSADGRIKPELLAPGAYDWGLAPSFGSEEGQHFQLFGGTSQAAPLVAGAAALYYEAFHKVHGRFPTPNEAVRALTSSSDDLGLPAHMQGAGRVNCLKAVEAVQNSEGYVLITPIAPVSIKAGSEGVLAVEVINPGRTSRQINVETAHYAPAPDLSLAFNGQIATAQTPQHISFKVLPGTDLIQVSLNWPSRDHTPQTPRLMLAIYDPEGRFVNYQRPNSSGDLELGKSVDTWVARPTVGTWTARIILRLGVRDTVQVFSLSVRAHRRKPYNWVETGAKAVALDAGESRQLRLKVRVPADVTAATYSFHIAVGDSIAPASVVVPMSMERGSAAFSGSFQHGYQGSWGNGDWYYHDLPIPKGTRSLITSIQWPDVDNALECYLIDPKGTAVMGRANNADILDDGDSKVLGGQIVMANPRAGLWRVALHSFAFCGRSMPEPYAGYVELAGELVTPRSIQMRISRGESAPMALMVKNPGRMPLVLKAVAQSTETRLVWQNLSGTIKSGVDTDGKPFGQSHITLGQIDVPFGTRQVGAVLNWDRADAAISVSLYDPVSRSDRSTVSGTSNQAMVIESTPVPGPWTVMVGLTDPAVHQREVAIKGAAFFVAPLQLDDGLGAEITIQPGAFGVLPITLRVPDGADHVKGHLVVSSSVGDILGEVAFVVEVSSPGEAEAAAVRE